LLVNVVSTEKGIGIRMKTIKDRYIKVRKKKSFSCNLSFAGKAHNVKPIVLVFLYFAKWDAPPPPPRGAPRLLCLRSLSLLFSLFRPPGENDNHTRITADGAFLDSLERRPLVRYDT